ncbi:hypothetical protein OAF30_04210 [Flavobacteriales bacterium]|nr:hypothetical protein [Flavobacteriales bacterium]
MKELKKNVKLTLLVEEPPAMQLGAPSGAPFHPLQHPETSVNPAFLHFFDKMQFTDLLRYMTHGGAGGF